MKLGYRITRFALLLIPAIVIFSTHISLEEISIVFGASVLTGAFAIMLFIFFHFDEKVNTKIMMESLADAFFGIVIFTYPTPDNQSFLIIFSSWIFFMGTLQLVPGLKTWKTATISGFTCLPASRFSPWVLLL